MTTANTITVTDKLVVCDPCYVLNETGLPPADPVDRADLYGTVIENAAGTWTWRTVEADTDWGRRVAMLIVEREGAEQGDPVEAGRNGVDSGRMWAGPHEALPLDKAALMAGIEENEHPLGGGACSATGFGDGEYRVLVGYDPDDGRPSGVRVRFIRQENDDEMETA